jgi:hypothetical protein
MQDQDEEKRKEEKWKRTIPTSYTRERALPCYFRDSRPRPSGTVTDYRGTVPPIVVSLRSRKSRVMRLMSGEARTFSQTYHASQLQGPSNTSPAQSLIVYHAFGPHIQISRDPEPEVHGLATTRTTQPKPSMGPYLLKISDDAGFSICYAREGTEAPRASRIT